MKSLFYVFLLVGIVSLSYSAPIDDDLVTNLEDFNKNNIKLYSGLLNVNPTNPNLKLHYVFVESKSNPATDPLIVWLNGGPGCSSLLGLFEEHGPLIFEENKNTLTVNKFAWNTVANVVYLESPVGVGFSEGSYNNYTDEQTSKDNLQALLQFYIRFPQFKTNSLFISGESYAGVYVPYFASHIIDYNASTQQKINFKGILVGNGVTDLNVDMDNALVDFAYDYALYGSDLRKELSKNCGDKRPLPETKECIRSVENIMNSAFPDTQVGFNIYDVFRRCTPGSELLEKTHSNRHLLFPLGYYKKKYNIQLNPPCSTSSGTDAYLNRDDVKQALHVKKETKWEMCNEDVHDKYKFGQSVDIYPKLISNNVRILIYSGDSDGAVPYLGTRKWVSNLNLGILQPYRSWQISNTEVSGYVQVYKGLTLVTIKGTGHMAPQWRPEEALYMVKQFLLNKDL